MRNLTKASLATALLGALMAAPAAQARTVYATVLDVEPIRTGYQHQVCEPNYRYNDHRRDRYYDDRYSYNDRRDHNNVGGAVAGAIIGGALGNQVGDGNGRTAATVAGAVIGGLAGREIQDRHHDRRYNGYDNRYYDNRYYDNRYYDNRYGQSGQRCWTEYRNDGRISAYQVTYRAEGRIQTTQMSYAPRIGSRIRIDTRW
jgi:uncharacterized protein YcfJ